MFSEDKHIRIEYFIMVVHKYFSMVARFQTLPLCNELWNLVLIIISKISPQWFFQMAVVAASSIMWSFASHLTSGERLLSFAALDWPELYHTSIGLPWVPMIYTGLFTTSLCLTFEVCSLISSPQWPVFCYTMCYSFGISSSQ